MTAVSANVVLLVAVGVLLATGLYLILERTLGRIVLGVVLAGNGINLLVLVTAGRAGLPPVLSLNADEEISDPLPQAMVLTAIVITLGITAFLLAMAYRSWQLVGHDVVQDDATDRRLVIESARAELRELGRDEARRLRRAMDLESRQIAQVARARETARERAQADLRRRARRLRAQILSRLGRPGTRRADVDRELADFDARHRAEVREAVERVRQAREESREVLRAQRREARARLRERTRVQVGLEALDADWQEDEEGQDEAVEKEKDA